MSGSTALLRHQINGANDLQSVVRTMRAVAASSIHQYESSVLALADYRKSVNVGLGVCLRFIGTGPEMPQTDRAASAVTGLIVFGSDQGLVGQFNERIVEHVTYALPAIPGERVVWAVGERVMTRLQDAGVDVVGVYPVPGSVAAIATLVDRIQFDTETHSTQIGSPDIRVFYNRPRSGALYESVDQCLLPLNDAWRAQMLQERWPGTGLPEALGDGVAMLESLVREYLFISLFRACAESLASENASRLAAMERADRNIDKLLKSMQNRLYRERQSAIDEELFDVVAGYEALS